MTTGGRYLSTPGPGDYDTGSATRKLISASPNYRVGTSRRSDFTLDGSRSGSPGPGAYDKAAENGGFRKTGFSFGSSTRPTVKKRATEPGPGSYLGHHKPDNSPSFSFRPRTVTNQHIFTPGPGSYHTASRHTEKQLGPSYRIGTSHRQTEPKSVHGPGPGQYTPSLNQTAPSWGFGSTSKKKKASPDTSGGLGYEIPSSFPQSFKG
jgi:hypothetical protein